MNISALRPKMAKNAYKADFIISTRILCSGGTEGTRKVNVVRIQLDWEILTEMSVGASHNFTAAAPHNSMSSTVWIPWWKNSGEHLQSDRIARMRTSLSERGSGKIRLALGRVATRLVIPRLSISIRRRPVHCGGELISRAWDLVKGYTLSWFHDFVLQPKSPVDPAVFASETEPHLVLKSNMHEWHTSWQVLIVQAQGKSWTKDQNLPQVKIDRLPQGRQHIGRYQYRRVIPRTVYEHYPNYKERSGAVK
jgi:hypothetical protein